MARSGCARPLSDATRAELLIVGAGPVGLYAAYYAGFRGLETTIVDALPIVGGQVAVFYPEATLYDVPGFPAVRGDELVQRLEQQMRSFPIRVRLSEEVFAIEPAGDSFAVSTETRPGIGGDRGRRRYEAAAVLLACGIGSFSPQRVAEADVARFEDRGLAYHVSDAGALAGRRVLVVGGTARAVELALATTPIAGHVTLVHRRDRLASGDAAERLAAAGVQFLPFRDLLSLEGDERVERAVLADRRHGSRETIAVDAVLPCHGFSADPAALHGLGIALEGDAALVDTHMATSRPRIYAAGDGATYPGKVRVLAADFGEACTAVNNVAAALFPGASVFPGYSSHRRGAAQRPRPRSR